MAATSQSQSVRGTTQFVCPDPSAHEHPPQQKRLQDQSANAALYVTHPERATNVRDINPLGPDGKLSAAGAAASLKYARAEDLPSFPSVGIDTKNSGLAAASLAAANPKDVQWWKPEMSKDAGKAALLAHDYKMAPLWQPEASVAGSKAALLAAQGKGRDWWQPTASKEGLKAATLATQNKNLGPQLDYGYTEDGRSRALLAATLSVKGRKRSDSTPEQPTGQAAALQKSNSLKAATLAHSDRANEASRIVYARNLPRQMFTEHPDTDIDKQAKAHQSALQGASISMAQKLYAVQKVDDSGHLMLNAGQAARTADRQSVDGVKDLRQQALQYLTLQEAAQRLAAERLAKIEDQHEATAFRDYYGYGSAKRRSRLGIKGWNRRRASSEGAPVYSRNATEEQEEEEPGSPQPHRRGNLDVDSDDEEQAARVRSQMNTFNAKLAEADKKRRQDREALLAAAEKRVQARMSQMDKKLFDETGKMTPAMMEEWDNRARAKAVAASQARMHNHGKVDIGGGRYMDQSEIDAIAMSNIKPTLDEINETAEKQRARDEEIRLEKEEQKRLAQRDKERKAENKAIIKQTKAEDKEAERARKREEKLAAQHERTLAKEERHREKGLAKEEKQREKETSYMQREAVAESAALMKEKERNTESPTKDRKSPWKKLFHHSHEEREPGKLSSTVHHEERETAAEPDVAAGAGAAATAAAAESQEEHKPESVELTPTGATMANDTPAAVAAPEATPATEAAIDAQAVTPVQERSAPLDERVAPIGTATADKSATFEDVDDATAPGSPSKKRFSRILGKLKRSSKDKPSSKHDDAETGSSFSGGAKLSKARKSEGDETVGTTGTTGTTVTNTSYPEVAIAAAATEPIAVDRRPGSPSISSLSSDEQDEEERRGRTPARDDAVAVPTVEVPDKDRESEEENDEFSEARDHIDESVLAPPKGLLSKKHTESPVRDSKFHEVL